MSEYPYLPLFTRDFLADTMHLSAQETGAYVLLLMQAWLMPDCSLPADDRRLAQWARVDAKTWRAIKPTVMEFWTLADGRWQQKRLTKEREHVAAVSEKRRAAIRKRWDTNVVHLNNKSNSNGIHPHAHAHPEKKDPTRAVGTSQPINRASPNREGIREGDCGGGE